MHKPELRALTVQPQTSEFPTGHPLWTVRAETTYLSPMCWKLSGIKGQNMVLARSEAASRTFNRCKNARLRRQQFCAAESVDALGERAYCRGRCLRRRSYRPAIDRKTAA